jgi:hypothetical protein
MENDPHQGSNLNKGSLAHKRSFRLLIYQFYWRYCVLVAGPGIEPRSAESESAVLTAVRSGNMNVLTVTGWPSEVFSIKIRQLVNRVTRYCLWRFVPDSNRGWSFCRALPYHLANEPLNERSMVQTATANSLLSL